MAVRGPGRRGRPGGALLPLPPTSEQARAARAARGYRHLWRSLTVRGVAVAVRPDIHARFLAIRQRAEAKADAPVVLPGPPPVVLGVVALDACGTRTAPHPGAP